MPLRKQGSSLSETILHRSELRSLFNRHHCGIAAQALMFTELELIEVRSRDQQGNKKSGWSVKAKRGAKLHHEGQFTMHSLHISASGNLDGICGEWHLFAHKTEKELPSQFQPLLTKHRLRHPIKIAFAAGPNPSKYSGQLFATMPLPEMSGLPVHFHAPFILTSDRGSIRLSSIEGGYNKWLREIVAPSLYVYLLERLLQQQPEQPNDYWMWWPKPDHSNPLTLSLYTSLLAETQAAIYITTTNQFINPSQAIFFVGEGHPHVKLLNLIGITNLVEIPAFIQTALKSNIKLLDPVFVQKALLMNADKVKAALADKTRQHITVKEIMEILRFLLRGKRGTPMSLQGLPLLPLSNGTFATFQFPTATHTGSFFVWNFSNQDCSPFPADRLIDPDFRVSELEELERDYNVSKLDGSAVKELIAAYVQPSQKRANCNQEYSLWVDSFWKGYDKMGIHEDDIASFPLVLTSIPELYVSLRECRTGSVLIPEASEPRHEVDRLLPGLNSLGITVVFPTECPPALRKIIRSSTYSHADVWNIVRFFNGMDQSAISSSFNYMAADQRTPLAIWLTKWMNAVTLPEDLHKTATASYLPIWPLLDGSGFVAATDATMLPADITFPTSDILECSSAALKGRLVAHSAALEYTFRLRPLTHQTLWSALDLKENRTLKPNERASCHRLLRAAIQSRVSEIDGSLLVIPDGHSKLVKVRNLYGRSQPLFLSTFEIHLDKLIHSDFLALEQQLARYGLNTEMNTDSFIVCAETIHSEAPNSARRLGRATNLYKWYSEKLSDPSQENRWAELDNFRFIPPTQSARAESYEFRHLKFQGQDLFSPQEVLLPIHEPIAWTQRAMFKPSIRLTSANPNIGKPTPIEVVSNFAFLS